MTTVMLPVHIEHDHFSVVDNCLQIGGMPVTRLAEAAGSTPFYAYDRELISRRIAFLRQHLPDQVHIHYAIKANPMPAVVQHLSTLVDGLDVASAGEMRVALDTSMAAARISFAGPGKTGDELLRALNAGIVINVESDTELGRISELADRQGLRPQIAVRVNPDFELKTSGMKMAGGPKQFGIDAEHVPAVLRRLRDLPVSFVGFHIFSGSQNLRSDAIREAQDKTVELAIELARHAPAPVRLLNIGGGLGIPYFPGDKPVDARDIGENLHQLVGKVATSLPEATMVLELGRFLIGEAGVYVCRVVDRKVSRGQTFLITDGGLHHHLAASGNFGQVIRKNYPVLVGNRVFSDDQETVSVVGPLCTPLDILADRMTMPAAEIGDLIVVLQSGAYGLSASPTRFLGHSPPGELLV